MTDRHRDLSAALRDQLDRWKLRTDGPIREGPASLVAPVVTADDVPAVLKVGARDSPAGHEHLVLRRWGGDGAVRLLRADPPQHAVLLERLHPQSLTERPDSEACEIVAGLYRRLHVPPMPQLPSLHEQIAQWIDSADRLPRRSPLPHRLVEQAAALARELTSDSVDSVVLHGDLHSGNVFAADRLPWLAISPEPMNGDPHYELAPMLWHRWDELTHDVRDGVRRRFYTLVDTAGLDEDRARAWTLIRVVWTATREPVSDTHAGADALTRYVAVAKAVQD
ncbi:aminoglycoside phosphotransferase family protein [Mycobacterium sp. ITM-2016-00317]|uniref:aminoglycoside phosphotransferase family protein n=1 Tax=Mycobacterium sp. ITM-2016-00317 TaxID=2099694 RepID=UPI00287F79AB|nr:aminoglycoside phosphotransferase family protein [Mycobacterium sp. ITM-2016-00317]WNG89232.1 aminoglycoside phosphotransferase family protein [Mycobacterium sp. ITM-2016-00317]